jgi:hypothetical protein
MRWIERLTKRGGSVRQYQELSGSWDTCAVGEARQDFPAVVVGQPMMFHPGERYSTPQDRVLYRLGAKFHEEIVQGHRNRALKVYNQIQRRVIQLLLLEAK